jgi:hypothetical protein
MGPGHPLVAGASLRSADGFVVLTMQANGDLAARAGTKLLWRSGTTGHGNFAQVLISGSLIVFNRSKRVLWSTKTRISRGAAFLTVQNTGDLTLSLGSHLLWHSRTRATTLPAGGRLGPGQFVVGAGGEKLIMQSNGNLVVFRGATALWSTSTRVHGSAATVQSDGNFVVYSPARRVLWSSHTGGSGKGARVVIEGDGDVRLLSAGGRSLWQSYTTRVAGSAELAIRLLHMWGSKVDGLPAVRADLVATSRNLTVASPCGGRVRVDRSVLSFLNQVTANYRIKINNIVTGHACDSGGHPRGRAVDIGMVTSLTTGTTTGFGGHSGANNLALDAAFVNYSSKLLPNGAGLGQRHCPGQSAAHPRAGVQFFDVQVRASR